MLSYIDIDQHFKFIFTEFMVFRNTNVCLLFNTIAAADKFVDNSYYN